MRVQSVQTGAARRVRIGDRSILTAYGKAPVAGEVAVMPLGILGDEQADLSIHGGLEKAVYAYPSEHYAFWQNARCEAGISPLDDRLLPGALGENLTLQGLLETDVWAGDVLSFANCALKVTLPREPCYKFNAAIGFSRASRLMADTGYCGFYLSVLEPGKLQAGEAFELVAGRRSVGIPTLFAAKRAKHVR
ncbi:MAG: domain containing protein [Polaromonas sp.]|jgi:MOSC domain-containing protein YiiM|nr:domain containing protein [Polaromonas sp.]